MTAPPSIPDADVWAWASRMAADLEPFDADTAAAVGRVAATIDARRAARADAGRAEAVTARAAA